MKESNQYMSKSQKKKTDCTSRQTEKSKKKKNMKGKSVKRFFFLRRLRNKGR